MIPKKLEKTSTPTTKYRHVYFVHWTYDALLADEIGLLLRCRWGIGCTFGRRCCCDDNCGNRFRGACCHVLLELLRLDRLNANLKEERQTVSLEIQIQKQRMSDFL